MPDSGGVAGDVYPPVDPAIEARVEAVLSKMTLEEKVDQMHGSSAAPVNSLYETAVNDRLGIPSFRMVDGPRGVRAGKATTFPVGMARGATWDPALETRVGEAMGAETAAKGGNVLLAPTINLLRHPAWGRAQETYGEDVQHVGTMGVAFIEGAQRHVLASAKHFAANSIEHTRLAVDVSMDERTLREIYLPHFRRAVQQARVASVMSAYNSVNGHFCSENVHLLHDVLNTDWRFDGFVESDWVFATHTTTPSALAGLDVEMPTGTHFGQALLDAVAASEVPEAVIDDAVRRILRKKYAFHLDAPDVVSPDVVESKPHTDLTLEVAREAIVLLKNQGSLLPLDRQATSKLVVVGPLAASANLGDHGSSNAEPSWSVAPLDGLKDRLGAAKVSYVAGPTFDVAAQAQIAGADAVVIVAGLDYRDEGEELFTIGGDRTTLAAHADEQQMIHDVAALNARTVVVLEGGSAITVKDWLAEVPALVMAWYPGQEGGHAIADVLLGDVTPSGKLPLSIPVDEADLPPFDSVQKAVTYDYWHGYRHLDRNGTTAQFPFGFGLSYTTFQYGDVRLGQTDVHAGDTLKAAVDVSNAGSRAGAEVVEAYVAYPESIVDRPKHDLRAFARVDLQPGETKSVELSFPVDDLAYWDVQTSAFIVERVRHTLQVGGASDDLPASADFHVID